MDLVAIGSPSGLHAEHGIAAARRGLHVLVEKPIDITTDRADALIDAADRAGVKLGVFFQDRLKPAVVRMKTSIETGRLGTPVLASGHVKWYRPPEYYGGSRWRGTWALDGGGALMNQGIHTVDVLLNLFGSVARVSARIATRVHAIEVEDTAVAALEFTSGALGIIETATSIYPGYARRVEVTGSEGTLVLDQDRLVRADLRIADRCGRPRRAAPAPAKARRHPSFRTSRRTGASSRTSSGRSKRTARRRATGVKGEKAWRSCEAIYRVGADGPGSQRDESGLTA